MLTNVALLKVRKRVLHPVWMEGGKEDQDPIRICPLLGPNLAQRQTGRQPFRRAHPLRRPHPEGLAKVRTVEQAHRLGEQHSYQGNSSPG